MEGVRGVPTKRHIVRPRALSPLIRGALGLALGLTIGLNLAGPVLAEPPATEGAAPDYATPLTTWSINLYDDSVVRFQNPDWRACTAAATLSMLNMIALASTDDMPRPHGGLPRPSFHWQIDVSYGTQTTILDYERANMTMAGNYPGTDPHGWRNALNFFGWGSINAGFYRDSAYSSFDEAARATVVSLARHGRPVGILGWYGSHAQYVTGYTVRGNDPRVSDDWTLIGVFLTDPLEADQLRNKYIAYSDWKYGSPYRRLSPYWQKESWIRDPIDGAIGFREWWGKFVIIDAVK